MKRALPWWVRVVVVAGASLFAAGGIIALMRPEMLVSPHGEIDPAAHVYAGYMFSRNLALAVVLLAALIADARQALSGLMMFASLVQVFDAGVDIVEGRIILVPGVIVLGALFAFAAARLYFPVRRELSGGPR